MVGKADPAKPRCHELLTVVPAKAGTQ